MTDIEGHATDETAGRLPGAIEVGLNHGAEPSRPVERREIDSVESELENSLAAKEVISSTPEANLPIVFGGSAVELPATAEPESSVDDPKEETMSIVDRVVSEAVPQDTPMSPAPEAGVENATADVAETLDVDDEYEYEYVDDDGGEEVATTTGDVDDEVEYEYEYVDDDEERGRRIRVCRS